MTADRCSTTLTGVLTATSSYPFPDEERAAHGLRHQLRAQAHDTRVEPDWRTFKSTGPAAARGAYGLLWYCWTATVETLL